MTRLENMSKQRQFRLKTKPLNITADRIKCLLEFFKVSCADQFKYGKYEFKIKAPRASTNT